MALTFTEQYRGVVSDRRVWRGTVTFDSSYPTGGEAVTAADFGFDVSIETVIVGSNDEAGVSCRWDGANSKLKLFDEDNTSGIEAEFGNGTDASANVTTLEAYGR